MAGGSVVRQDIVQIRYDIEDSPLQRVGREVNQMRNNITGAVRRSDSALNDLQEETQDLRQDMRQASNSADDMGDSFRDAGNQAEDATDSIGGLQGVIGKLVGAAGGVLKGALGGAVLGAVGFGAAFQGANNLQQAMNQLQAQTGASAKEMAEFEGIAKDLYSDNMGESLDDVAKSMANVKNVTGASGDELKDLTNNALLLRDTFDFDVNESVRSADMLMKQFGIDGTEAYNLIAQGAQLGLDKNGNLLDSFNEYSVHFKQLGLDSKDMLSIFANSAEQGVFDIDKIGDAVKEFGIRAKDGSKTTIEGFTAIGLNADEMAAKFGAGGETAKAAFQETIAGLAAMEDPIAREAAGVQLFGTMWEDLGPKAVLAMNTTNAKVQEGTGALQQINEVKYNDATSALSSLGRTINMELAGSVGGAVNVAVAGIKSFTAGVKEAADFTREHWETIGPIITAVGVVLGAYITLLAAYTAGTALATAAEKLKAGALTKSAAAMWANTTAMLANPMTWVVLGIMALIVAIVLLIKNWDKVKAAVLSFTSVAMGYLNTFWTWLQGIFTAIGSFIVSIFTGIYTFFASIWQAIWGVIGGAVTAIWQVISTTFSYIFQIIAVIMQGIWQKIVSVWQFIWSGIVTVMTTILNFYITIWSAIFSFIGGILSSIWGVISSTWSSIWSTIVSFLGQIYDSISAKFDEILSWLGGLKDSFLEIGSNLIQGLMDGIKNKAGELLGSIQELGEEALAKAKAVFGVHSPSTEFAIIGRYNVEGMEKGMQDELPALKRVVQTVGETSLGTAMSSYTPDGRTLSNGGTSTTTNTYNPQFNLTIQGGNTSDRDMERKVKQWIAEAMRETFNGIERKQPRLQEV